MGGTAAFTSHALSEGGVLADQGKSSEVEMLEEGGPGQSPVPLLWPGVYAPTWPASRRAGWRPRSHSRVVHKLRAGVYRPAASFRHLSRRRGRPPSSQSQPYLSSPKIRMGLARGVIALVSACRCQVISVAARFGIGDGGRDWRPDIDVGLEWPLQHRRAACPNKPFRRLRLIMLFVGVPRCTSKFL